MPMKIISSLFSVFVSVRTKEIMYGKVFWLMVNYFANIKPILFSSYLTPACIPFFLPFLFPHPFKRLISTPKKVIFLKLFS